MRDYNKLVSEIRMATIGVEKPSSRLLLMQLAADAIEELRCNLKDCRNELCLKCGEYKQRHLGACDGCRWKERGNG